MVSELLEERIRVVEMNQQCLDFEREYADFLSSDLPKCPTEDSNDDDKNDEILNEGGNRSRRSSKTEDNRRASGCNSSRSSFDSSNGASGGGIRYNFDGTISCCDISYDLLVSFVEQCKVILILDPYDSMEKMFRILFDSPIFKYHLV